MNIKLFSTLLLCLTMFGVAIAQKSGKTKAYNSKEGKYSIHFPSAPQEERQDIAIEGHGNVPLVMHLAESSGVAFMVAYIDYPDKMITEATHKDPTKESLLVQEAKKGVIGRMEMTITEEKQITKNKHKGVFFKANNEQMYTAYEIFLVDNRLYQVGIIGTSAIPEATSKSFIQSFKLNK